MKICQVIASDNSNLLRKVDFPLKSVFQIIAFFFLLELGYLVIMFVNFDWFIFSEHLFELWFKIVIVTSF